MTDVIQEKCPVCLQPMHPYPMGDKNGYNLFGCRSCGSVMADPWVTDAEREKIWAEIDPEITHIPDPEGEIAVMMGVIKRMMPAGATGRRFLDINCRNGYAVVAAKKLNITEVKGIDPHEFFIRFAQSKYEPSLFEHTTLKQYAETGKQADIIVSRESFTEQTDIEGFTAALAKTLSPGGMAYIEEPNGNGLNTPKYLPDWPVVFPPLNFLYLSKKGITSILDRHGLKIQKFYFNWRPVMRMIVVKK